MSAEQYPNVADGAPSSVLDDVSVHDAMHWGGISCAAVASLRDVARIMATNRVHCVVVPCLGNERDGTFAERAWGLISDLALVAACTEGPRSAADLASPDVPIAEPHWALAYATAPIVVDDRRRPIGVLAALDIARVIAADNPRSGSSGANRGPHQPISSARTAREARDEESDDLTRGRCRCPPIGGGV